MKRTSAASVAIVVLVAALAIALAWASRGWPLVHDAPILHYIAWRIGEGDAPYRDHFDMNGPGTYVLHLAVLRLGGAGDTAWRVFDLGWLGVGAVAAAALARPWGPVAAAGAAAFLALYHLAGGAWQAGQRDFLLCPLLLAAAAGVARWAERGWSCAPLAGGALALGVAVTIKPHTVLLAGLLAAVVLAQARRAALAPLAVWLACLAVPPLAALAWLASAGALGAWRDVVFGYLLPVYSTLARPSQWTVYRWHAWIPLGIGVTLSLIASARRRALGVRHGVAVLGMLYGLAHYVGQGKGWEYHLYPLAAFAGVLLFAELTPALASRRPALGAALATCCLAATALLGVKGAEATPAHFAAGKVARVRTLVADLVPLARPGEPVQVLDTAEGGMHALWLLRARQPTRFVYDFPLFARADTPVVRRYRTEFLRGFDATPPRAVVVFRDGWPSGDAARVAGFPELAERLARDYIVATRRDAYVVHARRDGR